MQALVTSVTGPQTGADLVKRFLDCNAIMAPPRPADQEQHAVISISSKFPGKITGS